MSNFVYDLTPLPSGKSDLMPLPPGADATKYLQAPEWNTHVQASLDLRAAVRAGMFQGLTAQTSDPLPTDPAAYWWLQDTGVLRLVGPTSLAFTGTISAADPLASSDLATKNYVDTHTPTVTLQSAYEGGGYGPQIINLAGGGLGIEIRDAAEGIGDGNNLFALQNHDATTTYFAVDSSGTINAQGLHSSTGVAASVSFTAGNSAETSGDGGFIQLSAGNGAGSGNGGYVGIYGGLSAAGGTGGAVFMSGGQGHTDGGGGGDVVISGGSCQGMGVGGNLQLAGGDSSISGTGGNITLTPGTGTAGNGSVEVFAPYVVFQTYSTLSGFFPVPVALAGVTVAGPLDSSGDITVATIRGADSAATSGILSGCAAIIGGNVTGAGTINPGIALVAGGSSLSSTDVDGGQVEIIGGQGSGSGAGGRISLDGGQPGPTGNGSDIGITGGQAGASGGRGGNVDVVSGQAQYSNNNGGHLYLNSGYGAGTGSSGEASLGSGNSDSSTGSSGMTTLGTGTAGSDSGDSGQVQIRTGVVHGSTNTSGSIQMYTGNAVAGSSGRVSIATGSASGIGNSVGQLTLDTGSAIALATPGAIAIGPLNASTISIGSSISTTTINGAVNIPNLSAAHSSLTGLANDDHLQYALLAGRLGGQTLIGGSAVTDTLTLQGTSGNGTLTSPAINLNVGNAGATAAMTILNNGFVGIGTTAPAGLLSLKEHANFTGSSLNFDTAAVTTTTATTTTIFDSGALTDNTVYWFEARVVARDSTGAEYGYFIRTVCAYRSGAGVQIGDVFATVSDGTNTTWDVIFTPSGNNLLIQVVSTALTVYWASTVMHQSVSTQS